MKQQASTEADSGLKNTRIAQNAWMAQEVREVSYSRKNGTILLKCWKIFAQFSLRYNAGERQRLRTWHSRQIVKMFYMNWLN